MTADEFAHAEFRDYTIYQALAQVESDPQFKKILNKLVDHEWGDYNFWLQFSEKKQFHIHPLGVFFLKWARRFLGLTFIAKLLEGGERRAIKNYNSFLATAPVHMRDNIRSIIEHERYHEGALVAQIQEDKVKFISSIMLGLNDALIEIIGALVGFSFAFTNQRTVALGGLITGIAASLSMASSAYLQAFHEQGKDPRKASLYTGVSYGTVVVILVLPYLLLPTTLTALVVMLLAAGLIILATAYYISIIFERQYVKQLRLMAYLSVGVAVVSFIIGTIAKGFLGVT